MTKLVLIRSIVPHAKPMRYCIRRDPRKSVQVVQDIAQTLYREAQLALRAEVTEHSQVDGKQPCLNATS